MLPETLKRHYDQDNIYKGNFNRGLAYSFRDLVCYHCGEHAGRHVAREVAERFNSCSSDSRQKETLGLV